jgi:hypothetical protein
MKMTKKAKLTLWGGAAFLAGLCLFALTRGGPRPPEFMKADRWELVEDMLNSYRGKTLVTRRFNVHRDIEDLLKDCMASPVFFRSEPINGQYSYFLTNLSKSGAIQCIQLNAGRWHRGKSFYTQDHQVPADYAVGWTAIDVVYRPNLGAKARDVWENRIMAALGKKPAPRQGVDALVGMQFRAPK